MVGSRDCARRHCYYIFLPPRVSASLREKKKKLAQSRRGAENLMTMNENDIGMHILKAAVNVHRELGSGSW